ncbi:MAG: aldehyde dehydrogenase family protein [Rhodobacteraceae bacterium]|nr:aldehyde dehydrogenase family protein [Paracoccaceae bacterium]
MDGSGHSFLTQEAWEGKIYSGGWIAGQGGAGTVRAPADDSAVASVGQGGAADVASAAVAARAAQQGWEATPAHERARILNAAADILERNGDELIPWIIRETGSIPPKAGIEVEHSAGFLRAAAAAAVEPAGRIVPSQDGRHEELLRVPHGVVGVISPFNFPLILSVRAIAAALATGNAVIHKPDPRTPITGGIIIARIFEEAGLPENLLHIVPGGADVGAALCSDPNIAMVSFTGSPEVGSKVGEACGRNLKRVQLELGGKNALVILDDADFTAAKASRLPVGNPATEQCALGPLISDAEAERIKGIVDDAVDKGAQLLAGGTPSGRMFPATVLAGVKPGMRAFEEEIFGPVAVVVAYDSDDHAVELANMSDYGLAAGIIGTDLGRARAIGNRLRVGHLHINDQTVMASPFVPFGGRGRSGNGSRISGPAIWEEFTQWVWVTTRPEAVV